MSNQKADLKNNKSVDQNKKSDFSKTKYLQNFF